MSSWRRRTKTHLIMGAPPNESDTDGSEYYLCGEENGVFGDRDIKYVDCKRCLKRITKGTSHE